MPQSVNNEAPAPAESEPGSIEQYLLELFGNSSADDTPDTSQAPDKEAPASILSFEDLLVAEPVVEEPSVEQPPIEELPVEASPIATPPIEAPTGEMDPAEEPEVAPLPIEEPYIEQPPLADAVAAPPQPTPIQLAPQQQPLQLVPPQPTPSLPLVQSPVRGWKPILVEGLAPPGMEAPATQPLPADEPIEAEASPADDMAEVEATPVDVQVEGPHFDDDVEITQPQPALSSDPDTEASPPQPITSEYDLSSLLDQIEIVEPESIDDVQPAYWPTTDEVAPANTQSVEETGNESALTGDTIPLETIAASNATFEPPTTAQAEEDFLPSWSPDSTDDNSLPTWQPRGETITDSQPIAREETFQNPQSAIHNPQYESPWAYSDPSKPRPKPGTPEYEEMVKQAMQQQRGTRESVQGTTTQPDFHSPTSAQMSSPQPPSPPTYADPNAPRPKPGTPEYEAMVREAMNQKLRNTAPLGNAPSHDTGPLPQSQEPLSFPAPPAAGASRPKPGTPEYEAMVKQAMEEMKRKRDEGKS